MKITLFLMSKKGLESLKAIIKEFGPSFVDRVYVHNDNNVVNDYYDEILKVCNENNILRGPILSNPAVYDLDTKFAIAISWRWLIHTRNTIVAVLHDSLLPRYKGWSPLVNSLINQEPIIGVSAFIASDEVDSGPLITQSSVEVSYPLKIEKAIDLIIPCYQEVCIRVIKIMLIGGKLVNPQEEEEVEWSMWLDHFDYYIDWSWSAEKIVNFVNAVGYPYTGAMSFIPHVIKILDCQVYPGVEIIDRKRHIGKVFTIDDGKYVVIAGEGLVRVNEAYIDGEELEANTFRIKFTN